MSLTILSPPATEPVSLSDAKVHLRVTHTAEDALIGALITAACERLEAELGLALITATFRDEGAIGETGLPLSRGPLTTIVAVSRDDGAGGWTALATSAVRLCSDGSPTRVMLTGLVLTVCGRLRIDYQAGYGAAAEDVPAGLRQAILALVGEAYATREAPPPAGPSLRAAEPWIAPFRRLRL